MEFIFEWDNNKAESNVKRHGVSFAEARTVFNDPLLITYPDDFHSDIEDRFISIGYSSHPRMLLVVHTERDSENQNELVIRIISCRLPTAAERKAYEESY